MEALVRLVKMPIETPGGSKNPVNLSVKLAPLSEKDDIEAYIVTFERMTAQKVDKGRWSQYLTPQLTGRAQLAFAALPSESAGDYDAISRPPYWRGMTLTKKPIGRDFALQHGVRAKLIVRLPFG